jgi:WS/DGAT/MGAT family acyltransferase
MRRLTGQDAQFLYAETGTQYAHTLKLAIMETPRDVSFDELKRAAGGSLHLLPMFRWRMVWTPLGLHHPLAIEDPDFDLDEHVHRAALPRPGGDRELSDFVSEVVSRPLDITRPLWEMWLVEGLAEGRIAVVVKVHHALADGVTTAALLSQLLTDKPRGPRVPEKVPWKPEAIPNRRQRLWLALRDLIPHLRTIWPAFLRAARATRAKRAKISPGERATGMYEGPNTRLNALLSSGRRYAFATLPLADLKAVKEATHTTVNDVFLAMVSGATRRYLEKCGELPGETLTAGVAVSTHTPDGPPVLNAVSSICVTLFTDVVAPLQRLTAIHRDARRGKAEFEITRGAQLVDVMDLLPPPLRILVHKLPWAQKRLGGASMANVNVSNVRGPSERLYWGDNGLASFYSVGPVLEGAGVNFTAYSYVDQFNVSILTDSRMLPDPWYLLDLLKESLEELRGIPASGADAAAATPPAPSAVLRQTP